MYRRSSRQRVALVALLAATATIVTLDFRQNPGGPIRRIQNVAVGVVAPLQDGMTSVFRPVSDFFSALGGIGELRRDNARLTTRNQQLEERERRVSEIVREYERLLELNQVTEWASGRLLGARVIGLGPGNHEWTAFVDKGTADGVRENMAVVAPEGLLGKVTLAEERYSKILLAIDPQHAAGARLATSGETGFVAGRGEEDLRFELIDPETKIERGETVSTSGYDRGIYPPGIPIGRVSGFRKSRDGLTQVAFVRPFVDFSRLDLVKILLDSAPIDGQR